MQTPVSVILCTHNPRDDYFRRALEGLRAQAMPLEQWEFLLIDNASSESLAKSWDISWHPRGRHIQEDQIGLTAARLRGIRESRGDLLVFVDDDNILAPNFLERAVAISKAHPYLGVFGAGSLVPEFEVSPPKELLPRLGLLAVRTVPSVVWSNNARDTGAIPWGAGLCVVRGVANHYRELVDSLNVSAVLGRRGQQLFSGEDDVFSWAAVAVGLGFGLFPELRLTHLIWAGRLNQDYFVRLVHDHTFSHAVLSYLVTGTLQKRIGRSRYLRLFLHGLKNGQFSMRCQWARLRGEDSAARFIERNRLRQMEGANPSSSESVVPVDSFQPSQQAKSSVRLPCAFRE
jgi:glycosyltransferase involved in cell wall biosynthesis